MSATHTILGNGDLIALEVHREGFVACPPQHEPIAEPSETITQVRIANFRDTSVEEDAEKRQLPSDFSTRCAFRIECELAGGLVFGSRVRLIHDSSDCKLVASETRDTNVAFRPKPLPPPPLPAIDTMNSTGPLSPKLSQHKLSDHKLSEKMSSGLLGLGRTASVVFDNADKSTHLNCAYLLQSNKKYKNNEDIWIVVSRYKLRDEGDVLYSGDAITFISAAFNGVQLGYNLDFGNQGFVGTIPKANKKYSFRVYQLSPADIRAKRAKSVLSGDYIRLYHQEMQGLMICRLDDEAELTSKIAPLGKVVLKHSKPKDLTHAVYIRKELQLASGNSIWQILKDQNLFYKGLTIDDFVYIRHLLTGQYLSMKKTLRPDGFSLTWVLNTSEELTEDCRFRMTSLDQVELQSELESLSGCIRFNQNISFVHYNSDLAFAANYEDDHDENTPKTIYEGERVALYKEDYPLKVSVNRESKTEVYKIRKVSHDEIQDTLFISRLPPLVRAATVALQLSNTDDLPLPIYRHLCVAIETLFRWVNDLAASEFSLLENSKTTFIDEGVFCSSLVSWLGVPCAEYHEFDFDFAAVIPRDNCASALTSPLNKFRQTLIGDSCLIDLLCNFNNVVHTLRKVKLAKAKEADVDRFVVPKVVNNVCILVGDLFHVSCLKNNRNAVRIISSKGALQTLVSHVIMMWQPPVSAVLAEALDGSDANIVRQVEESLMELSEYDVRFYVKQMNELRKRGKEAGHLLDLMEVLAGYGTPKLIHRFQNFIANESFASLEFPSFGNDYDEDSSIEVSNVSVFFSTQYNRESEVWEICMNDASFKLKSGKPSQNDFLQYFYIEFRALRELFQYYDSNSDGQIDFREAFHLLEEVGLAGAALKDELLSFQNVSLQDILKWWWERRNVYFSSYSATLNEVAYADVEKLFAQPEPPEFQREEGDEGTQQPSQSPEATPPQPGDTSKEEFIIKTYNAEEISDFMTTQLNARISGFKIIVENSMVVRTRSTREKRFLREQATIKEAISGMFPVHASYTWVPVKELLDAENTIESLWFRRCLQIFCQLCAGKNIGSQAVLNRLLPADCLIRMLKDSEKVLDRGLICKLICDLFVHHDFVFPILPSEVSKASYCSIDDISADTSNIGMGKLFNQYCQYSMRVNPFSLRVDLKRFVLSEISNFSLVLEFEQLDEVAAYQYSLLSLVKGLLSIDFFSEDFSTVNEEDSVDETKYLRALFFSKLKELYADFNKLESLKTGIKKTLDMQLKNRDISEADHISLEQRISKVTVGNLGIELSRTVSKYFTSKFTSIALIKVVDSMFDIIFQFFEIEQLTALKHILVPLATFENVYPELSKMNDIESISMEDVVVQFDKKFVKNKYSDDDKEDLEQTSLLMNMFYFDDRILRNKLINYMHRKMFQSDFSPSIESVRYFVSSEECIGKHILDRLCTVIKKYSAAFEDIHTREVLKQKAIAEADALTPKTRRTSIFSFFGMGTTAKDPSTDTADNVAPEDIRVDDLHVIETMKAALKQVEKIITSRYREGKKAVAKKTNIFSAVARRFSMLPPDNVEPPIVEGTDEGAQITPPHAPQRASVFSRLSMARRTTYAPLDDEESEFFLDEFNGYFPTDLCLYSLHLRSISIDLLQSVARLLTVNKEGEYSLCPVKELSRSSLEYVVMVADFLALVLQADPERFADAWMPYDKVVQHLLGVSDSIYVILEALYQYHPELETLVDVDHLQIIKDALYRSIGSPQTWPAKAMRAILLNEGQDLIFDLAQAAVEEFFLDSLNDQVVALSVSVEHFDVVKQMNAHLLTLLYTLLNLGPSPALNAKVAFLFPLQYCLEFLESRRVYLVSKGLLLQIIGMKMTHLSLDLTLIERCVAILHKIQRFTIVNSVDNFELFNSQWKKSFYFFCVNGFGNLIFKYIKSFTHDFDGKINEITQNSLVKRSAMTLLSESFTALMSMDASPSGALKDFPAIEVYTAFCSLVDVLNSGNMVLWKALEIDKSSLKTFVWTANAAVFLNRSAVPEEHVLRPKFDSFIMQVMISYDADLTKTFREIFLNRVGIKKYLRTVASYLHKRRTDTKKIAVVNQTNDYEIFVRNTFYSYDLSEKAIRKSSLYNFVHNTFINICKYMKKGGLIEKDPDFSEKDTKKSSIAGKLQSVLDDTTDFDIWRSAGGRLFSILAEFMATYQYESPPDATQDVAAGPTALLNVLYTLLKFRVSSDETIKISKSDKAQLHAYQEAYDTFGMRVMILRLLNRANKYSYKDSYFNLVPLLLRLGAMMMAEGSVEIQNAFMASIKGTSIGFVSPIRHILRECCQIYKSLDKDSVRKADLKMLRIMNEVSSFVRAFCGGHNKAARIFLRNQESSLGTKVDIVFDISEVVILLSSVLMDTYVKYIQFDFFLEVLAPKVWKDESEEKRNCIAWHDRRVDYIEMLQLLLTLGNSFKCLKDVVQGPCYENQQPALKTVDIFTPILAYCGVMHLNTVTKVPTKGITGVSFRLVRFEPGRPEKFLKAYKEELIRNGKLHEEPVWRGSQDDPKEVLDCSIGVDVDMMLKISKEVELNALKFLLALLEGTSVYAVNALNKNLDYNMIFQNMNADFHDNKQSFFGPIVGYPAMRKETAVAYLSLVSTLFSATAHSTESLNEWIEKCRRKGLDITSFNPSVEIIGQKGDIQQIFFTIPPYISSYWPYPEVQRVKDIIVVENDRDSPEEKINSFRKNTDLILSVMARQRQLAILLSPYIHAIFGGRPVAPSWVLFFVPRQRAFLLFLSLFLNIYYAYLTYRDRFPGYPGFEQYFNVLYDEINKEYSGLVPNSPTMTILDIAQWLHFTLNCSIYIRQLLNSRAADKLYISNDDEDAGDKKKKGAGSDSIKALIALYLVVRAEWWALAVCALSYGAIFFSQWLYVPVLLEIIPQFALMGFLVTAVRVNAAKIFFTILFALLILYFYATIAYLFFPDQYGIGNNFLYDGCGDLISCWAVHIDYGLNNPPQWFSSTFIKPVVSGTLSQETNPFGYLITSVLGTIYNISFIVLINQVIQSVISGVIIDTFSAMREKEENIKADIDGSCFICSIPRDEFESNGVDYKKHIKDEHNMWKYVWLKVYLNEKDPLLYTGPEHYAFQQMQDKQTFLKLFPVKKSLSLSRMKARMKEEEDAINLRVVYDVITSLELAQKELKKALADVKLVQDHQMHASDNLQLKFARLQLLNRQALEEFSSQFKPAAAKALIAGGKKKKTKSRKMDLTSWSKRILQIFGVTARGLKNVELFSRVGLGKNDPYVELSYGTRWNGKTTTLPNAGSEAEWYGLDMHIEISPHDITDGEIKVVAMDENSMFAHALIGSGTASLRPLEYMAIGVRGELTAILVDKKGNAAGTVTLTVLIMDMPKPKKGIEEVLKRKASAKISGTIAAKPTSAGEEKQAEGVAPAQQQERRASAAGVLKPAKDEDLHEV